MVLACKTVVASLSLFSLFGLVSILFHFETESCSAVHAGIELMVILVSQLSQCRDNSPGLPHNFTSELLNSVTSCLCLKCTNSKIRLDLLGLPSLPTFIKSHRSSDRL